ATHPSATPSEAETPKSVRLACVRHAASVRSEPGSNSQVHPGSTTTKGYAPARRPHSRASINARIKCAGHGRPQRRRPRIPSYLSKTKNKHPPRPTHTRLRGAALIGPPTYLRQLKSDSPSHRVRLSDIGAVIQNYRVFCFGEKQPAFGDEAECRAHDAEASRDPAGHSPEHQPTDARNSGNREAGEPRNAAQPPPVLPGDAEAHLL